MNKCIFKKKKRNFAGKTAVISLALLTGGTIPVHAAQGFDTATKAINILKSGFIAIVAGIGVILTIKNIMDIGTALQSHDTSTLKNNLAGLFGGLVMAGVGALLTVLGLG